MLKPLDKAGWKRADSGGGSHVVVTKRDHDGTKYTVPVAIGYDPIPPGTLRTVASEAGANDLDEFCRWIDRER